MSRGRASWQAEDMGGANAQVGGRSLHAFWPLLRTHFRWVLMEPHRRVSGDATSWLWNAPQTPPAPKSADLAGLRQRLGDAFVDFVGELERRDAVSSGVGAGELSAAVESTVHGLMRMPDGQLAAYAVLTDTGWMIRSWGFRVPAKATCTAEPEDETSAVTESDRGATFASLRGRKSRRFLLWLIIIGALLLAAGAAWVVFSPKPAEGVGEETALPANKKKEDGQLGNAIKGAASEDAESASSPRDLIGGGPTRTAAAGAGPFVALPLPVSRPRTAEREVSAASSTHAAHSNGGAVIAGFSSSVAGPASPEGGVGFAELSTAPSGMLRQAGPERAIAVPARADGAIDVGLGGGGAGIAVNPTGAGAAGRPPPAVASANLPELGVARAALAATPASPQKVVPTPIRAAARPAAPTVDIPNGVAPPPPDPVPKPSGKKSSPGTASVAASPAVAALPSATVEEISPVVTTAPVDSLHPAAIAPDPVAVVATPATPAKLLAPVVLKPTTDSSRTARDSIDEPADDPRPSLPSNSKEAHNGADASADSAASLANAADAAQSSNSIPSAPADVKAASIGTRVTLRLGEWRVARVRDVVLPTWPVEQGSADSLRKAREQAWARTRAVQPVSFREPRVRSGWSLRLAAEAMQPAPPVWRDRITGRPCEFAARRAEFVQLGWDGLLPPDDLDLGLVAADGRELARLTVSTRRREIELTTSGAVREAAPWFTFAPASAEAFAGGFRWESLSRAVWPDNAWERTGDDRSVGVICHASSPADERPAAAVLALVHPESGWALSCAVNLQTRLRSK